MKKIPFLLIIPITMAVSCMTDKQTDKNPFFGEYNTPYDIPPFERIENEHYLPAIKEGIKQQLEEIDAIVQNPEEPSFENTILELDKSGEFLNRTTNVFFNLNSANSDEDMRELAKEIGPMISEHKDNILLNQGLFERVKAVYDARKNAGTDGGPGYSPAQMHAIEKHYDRFVRNGANLSAEDQEILRKINSQLSSLQIAFGQNLLEETNKNFKLIIDQKEDLAGLPDAVIAGAAETAVENGLEGKWVFTLQKPSMIPFLQYAENRELREKIYRGYFMRGNNQDDFDNKEILKQISELRAEKAKLFGHETHAHYVIGQNMAKTPENVNSFLERLWEPALKMAKNEVKEMQAIIDAEGGEFELASWDWWYYAEKLRKQKYDLDEAQLKPYFKLENVRDGMFWVAKNLYGIELKKLNNVPMYHPDVEAYEVVEEDGKHVGVLYLDYHPRESKRVGAWCTGYREATYKDGKLVPPVISIVCNFTKPTEQIPSLLTWDEVTTLFHEFGHALHFLFVDGKYNLTAGNVPRDYVELPSQIMENFAAEPQVLKYYGKHYETGETISDELIEKIQKSGHFNQGFITGEYLAAAFLDLAYHNLKAGETIEDVLKFEDDAMSEIGLIEEIIPRYRSTYFNHIFSGEYYSAGYYVYIWAAVLDADAFEYFKQSGDIFNKELAAKFRENCLAKSGDMEGMEAYRLFRGQEPEVAPLLNRRGLNN
jgi:peptidyl-dipeptidase Dcp